MKLKTLTLAAIIGAFMMTSCGGEEKAKEENTETTEHAAETPEKEVEEEVVVEEVVVEETAVVDTEAGNALFTGNGCVACHQADTKTVGPSLVDIAAAYADNEAGLTSFLKEESDAIVDPAQFAVMQGQLALTKVMSDEDLSALVGFIMSNK